MPINLFLGEGIDNEMESKIFLITGSASGIGLHLTTVLAGRGHCIVATDLDETTLAAKAAEHGWPSERVITRGLDVRSAAAWESAVEQAVNLWGRLDVLLHVAGVIKPGYIKDITPEQIDLHMDINAKGTMYGTQIAAAQMIVQGGGQIINFASLAGIVGVPGIGLYSASKLAVRGFSLIAAYELAKYGIAVTVICPDLVRTPMLDIQLPYDEAALTFSGGRVLTVEDIEKAVDVALVKKPREITLPRSRGWMAKFNSLFPGLSSVVGPILTRRGRAAQDRLRQSVE